MPDLGGHIGYCTCCGEAPPTIFEMRVWAWRTMCGFYPMDCDQIAAQFPEDEWNSTGVLPIPSAISPDGDPNVCTVGTWYEQCITSENTTIINLSPGWEAYEGLTSNQTTTYTSSTETCCTGSYITSSGSNPELWDSDRRWWTFWPDEWNYGVWYHITQVICTETSLTIVYDTYYQSSGPGDAGNAQTQTIVTMTLSQPQTLDGIKAELVTLLGSVDEDDMRSWLLQGKTEMNIARDSAGTIHTMDGAMYSTTNSAQMDIGVGSFDQTGELGCYEEPLFNVFTGYSFYAMKTITVFESNAAARTDYDSWTCSPSGTSSCTEILPFFEDLTNGLYYFYVDISDWGFRTLLEGTCPP